MKALVVYFSRSGHTRQLAKEIAARCGADLEAIREARSREGVWGYCRSLWDALKRGTPPINAAFHKPAGYELVIIGTPVWNFGLAPPVRSYAQQHAKQFKQVAFFCTEGGSGDQRAFDELSRICGKQPVATFALTEKQLPEPAHKEPLRRFVARVAMG
ncbi:flavodoxin family protein [Piscinibacter sp.]|jgi:flavodoxin|uniref:flavodoxin family protein n=1 Tax=Piscinibacter sp. TaxID=1903157 RepID=UPI00355AC238